MSVFAAGCLLGLLVGLVLGYGSDEDPRAAYPEEQLGSISEALARHLTTALRVRHSGGF